MNLLFLCVANSARSQMAEGLARNILGRKYHIQSAGSHPSYVHPVAIEVMSEIGIDISKHTSKSLKNIDLTKIDLVVTLCADEICPVLPGRTKHLHHPIEDPAMLAGSSGDMAQGFRIARDKINQRIHKLQQELST